MSLWKQFPKTKAAVSPNMVYVTEVMFELQETTKLFWIASRNQAQTLKAHVKCQGDRTGLCKKCTPSHKKILHTDDGNNKAYEIVQESARTPEICTEEGWLNSKINTAIFYFSSFDSLCYRLCLGEAVNFKKVMKLTCPPCWFSTVALIKAHRILQHTELAWASGEIWHFFVSCRPLCFDVREVICRSWLTKLADHGKWQEEWFISFWPICRRSVLKCLQ